MFSKTVTPPKSAGHRQGTYETRRHAVGLARIGAKRRGGADWLRPLQACCGGAEPKPQPADQRPWVEILAFRGPAGRIELLESDRRAAAELLSKSSLGLATGIVALRRDRERQATKRALFHRSIGTWISASTRPSHHAAWAVVAPVAG